MDQNLVYEPNKCKHCGELHLEHICEIHKGYPNQHYFRYLCGETDGGVGIQQQAYGNMNVAERRLAPLLQIVALKITLFYYSPKIQICSQLVIKWFSILLDWSVYLVLLNGIGCAFVYGKRKHYICIDTKRYQNEHDG